MGVDLSPRDVELARRAAGGDGAAFVRLYDHYSADVFETSLAATGRVEQAVDATQCAFLALLKRPPAFDAPEGEVAHRLRTIALAARVDPAPNAGAGWLRSETVAKAGACFDEDWSYHLTAVAGGGRSVAEVAQTWSSDPASRKRIVEGVRSERPLPATPPRRRRRFRPRMRPWAPLRGSLERC